MRNQMLHARISEFCRPAQQMRVLLSASSGAVPGTRAAQGIRAVSGTRKGRTTPVHMTAPKVKTAPGLNFGAATALARQKSALRALNFEALGVGGLNEELQAALQRALVSRLAEPALIESLGIRHTKGILIHGPPGTGKTLLARKLARALGARPPKLVNGPEIFQKLVGQSEENLRELFAPAEREWKAKGTESPLHMIVFDEVDAICKERGQTGMAGGSGVHDSVVNQLLSKIDGLASIGNLLVIGVTNRPELLDQALLRPGRLELHVEMGLPDVVGREEILQIHTRALVDNGALELAAPGGGSRAADTRLLPLSLQALAKSTPNFTGAELEALVLDAVSRGLTRALDTELSGKHCMTKADSQKSAGRESRKTCAKLVGEAEQAIVRLGAEDFAAALSQATPALGSTFGYGRRFSAADLSATASSEKYSRAQWTWPLWCRRKSPFVDALAPAMSMASEISQLCKGEAGTHIGGTHSSGQQLTIFVGGDSGSGRTSVARELAIRCAAPFAREVSPAYLLGISGEGGFGSSSSSLLGGTSGIGGASAAPSSEAAACEAIRRAFADAHRSKVSVLLLDDVDRLVRLTQWLSSGERTKDTTPTPNVSEPVLHTLWALLRSTPPAGSARIVILTTAAAQHSCSSSVERMLGLDNIFDMRVDVPALNADEADDIVRNMATWQWRSGSTEAAADAAAALVHSTSSVPPLKRLLLALEQASQKSVATVQNSMEAQASTTSNIGNVRDATRKLCIVEDFSACLFDTNTKFVSG